jgi:hypothetical protein
MTVKRITIPCDLLTRMGRQSHEGVPFRMLSEWVNDLRRDIPDEEEASCVVLGSEHLSAVYEHLMTPAEIAAERLEHLEALRREVAGILGRPGTVLTADELERLRVLVGA